jgi:hypothetical protein
MLSDPVLLNDWHVVAYAPDLQANKPMRVRLLDEDIVLWRVGEKICADRRVAASRTSATRPAGGTAPAL